MQLSHYKELLATSPRDVEYLTITEDEALQWADSQGVREELYYLLVCDLTPTQALIELNIIPF